MTNLIIKQRLNQIFDGLMTISTKGEDTVTMAQCLQALNQLVQLIPEVEQTIEKEEE